MRKEQAVELLSDTTATRLTQAVTTGAAKSPPLAPTEAQSEQNGDFPLLSSSTT